MPLHFRFGLLVAVVNCAHTYLFVRSAQHRHGEQGQPPEDFRETCRRSPGQLYTFRARWALDDCPGHTVTTNPASGDPRSMVRPKAGMLEGALATAQPPDTYIPHGT